MLNLYFQGVTFLLANRSQTHLQGVTLFFCSNRCPFPRVKDPQKRQWKTYYHWNWFTLSANSWRQKSHNSEMIRHVVFTWGLFTPLETLKPLNWLISEPKLSSSFSSEKRQKTISCHTGVNHNWFVHSQVLLEWTIHLVPMLMPAFYNN